ncbi:MAG: alanine racemase [Nocardioidaceae bacterium]|nr:alanine racemase [Nocardioidaceae bacterium]
MSALASITAAPRTAPARLTVDPAAIAANAREIASRTDAVVMAVVKADGFGHGAVTVARTALANGATWLGVTSLAEGIALREAGLTAPVLSWLNPVAADWTAAVAAGIDVAIGSLAHLEALLATPSTDGARVHLHLDTGMARDGAEPSAWVSLCRTARRAEQCGRIRVVGLMGHLPCAGDPAHPANTTGRTRFAWGLGAAREAGLRPEHRHLAATAATLTDRRSHHTLVRVGAGLVGIDPSATTPLAGALTLTAPLVAVRRVRGGTGVGYDHTWTAPGPTTLGLLPLGYADGLPRVASGRAEVVVRGRRRPLVGLISMDQAVVDLGNDTAEPGEQVTVLGPGTHGEPTIHDWAGWSGTLPHEIVTGLGARAERVVLRQGPRGLA